MAETLDLSEVLEGTPVKLPSGRQVLMATMESFVPSQLVRIQRTWDDGQAILQRQQFSEADEARLDELLVGFCQAVLPDADGDEIAQVATVGRASRLAAAFFEQARAHRAALGRGIPAPVEEGEPNGSPDSASDSPASTEDPPPPGGTTPPSG